MRSNVINYTIDALLRSTDLRPQPLSNKLAGQGAAVAGAGAAAVAGAAANVSAQAEGAADAITAAALAEAGVAATAAAAAAARAAAAAAVAAAVISSPAGVVVGRAEEEGLVWADTGARRVLSSAIDGMAARPLWWLTWRPEAVQLSSYRGAPSSKAEPGRSQLLALEPLGGPTAGGTVLTLHGLALGAMRRLRYASEGEWLPPQSSGLSQAFLPICDARCPQVAADVVLLDDAWRKIGSGVPLSGSGDERCDGTPAQGQPPQPMAAHETMEEARWYRYVGSSGHHMLQQPPGDRSCSTDAPGWLSTPLPAPGAAPAPGTVCFKYGSSQCTYSLDVQLCACSFDGGDTVVHTYRLPRPPALSNCLAFCADGVEEDAVPVMPGEPEHSNAHLDLATQSRLLGRTPPLPAQRVQLQVAGSNANPSP